MGCSIYVEEKEEEEEEEQHPFHMHHMKKSADRMALDELIRAPKLSDVVLG
jgi:hypothetical protein